MSKPATRPCKASSAPATDTPSMASILKVVMAILTSRCGILKAPSGPLFCALTTTSLTFIVLSSILTLNLRWEPIGNSCVLYPIKVNTSLLFTFFTLKAKLPFMSVVIPPTTRLVASFSATVHPISSSPSFASTTRPLTMTCAPARHTAHRKAINNKYLFIVLFF